MAVRDRIASLRLGLDALRAAETRTLRWTAGGLLVIVPVALLWAAYRGERMVDAFPADYSWALGPGRPFAPSLATTATGGAYKGVLNEGDRRDARHVAAPPLSSPLGRLLFGAPIATLRGRAAAGDTIDAAVVTGLWRDARRLRRQLAARSQGPAAVATASSR